MKAKLLTAVFLGLLFTACTQEPLFWYVSQEYPPIEPLIGGAPTQIVDTTGVPNNTLYVANRNSLWEYKHGVTNRWNQAGKPPGAEYIKAIAATTTPSMLYLLSENGDIYKFDGANWNSPVRIPGAQQVFGANDKLFAGNGQNVYVYNGSGFDAIGGIGADIPGGLLLGAAKAGSDYYICTAQINGDENTGIFRWDGGSTVTKVYSSSVKGIIAVGTPPETVVAVTGGTIVYQDSKTSFTTNPGSISPGVSFTGGMAAWEHGGDTKILLGLQDGSGTFRYGYRELDLDSGGNVVPPYIFVPGTTINRTPATTSIDSGSRETSAIGKHPVTSLYAIKGSSSGDGAGRPIIFASTLRNGVWSYRTRRGVPQWNGEDNSTR
ncbi:MAG: hypothetical protein LBP29_10405 [Treponema sp.]|jgi:hypothetical protein|nr:hypothetical protein [Treponema sp.]